MPARLIFTFLGLAAAFFILFVSILRTASVRYVFISPPDLTSEDESVRGLQDQQIDYYLAYHGPVIPGHILWTAKVARDKAWLFVTTNPFRKAELNLLLADKRISASKTLFEKQKYEQGYLALLKAESYFKLACEAEEKLRLEGKDTDQLLDTLTKASLKHRQVILYLSSIAPGDAVKIINEHAEFAYTTYRKNTLILLEKGQKPHYDPWQGE